ncbi:MAG: amidohydrolase family protein [bacterium]|nr:amidohydrolase family protein [Gammaproteobacteria bacterium]HIL96375.1 amidohydrolase family protein [Pseudomonadales bacterium]
MNLKKVTKPLWLLVTLLAYLPANAGDTGEITALVGAQIIDGIHSKALKQNVVLIEADRIVDIVERSAIPTGARIVDLQGATLLPGLIDSHAHPMMSGDDYQSLHVQKSSAYKALKGFKAMENLLNAGWTTLRVAGDADVYYGNQDIRKLIDEGVLTGPRIFGAAHYLSITGGGGDINYYSPEQHPIADGLIVDGVEEIRKAIRTEAKYGADWIKVLVTGAFMSVGDNPKSVQFSEEEFRALVAEATRQGMPIMAHAHAAEGIKMAVKLGVRSIEHGTYMDDEAIELMREHGTFLVPTIYVGDYYNDPRNNLRQQAVFDDFTKTYRRTFLDYVGKAHRAGVKVVVGVDLGGYDYDPTVYVRELGVLMEAGMSAMDAIQAATSVPAEMLNQKGRIGTIEKGALADVIAVPGDPLRNIAELERVDFVMTNGVIRKNSF